MDEFPLETPEQLPPAPVGPEAKKVFSRVGWSYAVMLGAGTGLQLLLLYLSKLYFPGLLESNWSVLLFSQLPLYLAAVPLGWCVLRRLPSSRPAENRLTAGRFFSLLVMCFAVMYVGNLIGVVLNMGIAAAKGAIYENPVLDLLQSSNVWTNLVCVVLLAPVMEELVFRKLLCDRIRVYGEGTAIVVSGFIFGLFHGNLYQFFYAFGVGTFFAWIYLRTGRVRYTMLLHGCINFLGGVLPELILQHIDLDAIGKLSTDDPQTLLNYAQGHLPELAGFGLYAMTVLALFILGLIFLIERRKQFTLEPAEKPLPRRGRAGIVLGGAGMIVYMLVAAALMVYVAISM